MPLDVVNVYRLRDAGLLVEIQQVALEIRVIEDAPDVAFEVAVIDSIKAHQRAE
ncbi:hypothetical protein D3C87_2195960 [compost metagenome]